MSPIRGLVLGAAAVALAGWGSFALAQHQHGAPASEHAPAPHVPRPDPRVSVQFPPELREHTLANMRDHLLALQQIQDALSRNEYDGAAKISEDRLGMSSLTAHGAHEVAKYMPQGMQDAGTSMHRGASRFAVSLQEAAITGDLRKPLGELANVTASCVACHAGYRLQ